MQYYYHPLSYFFKLCDLCEHSKRQLSDLVSKERKKKKTTLKSTLAFWSKINKYSIQKYKKKQTLHLYNNNASRVILCNMVHRATVNIRNTLSVTPIRDE